MDQDELRLVCVSFFKIINGKINITYYTFTHAFYTAAEESQLPQMGNIEKSIQF